MRIEIQDRLDTIQPEAWDALVGDGCPFFEYAFLRGLELTGCVGPESGWHPRYVLAWRGTELVGALPMFRKDNSYGEFIFDWAWADAAQRNGMPYYPKMVVAAPFSPVGGRRFLLAPGEGDEARVVLLYGAREAAVNEPSTGIHWLYIHEDEAAFLESHGLAIRHTHQFHWRNEGYARFDDFLARFRSKRRNQIRRERRSIGAADVRVEVICGSDLTDAHIDHAWRFYLSTVDKFMWGRKYLNQAFFEHLGDHFRHRLMLVLASRGDEVLAGAVNVLKGDRVYGRYWGCSREVRNLHFEVCSYAGIEACIERGVKVFEAGAGGGGHKFGRGFLPTVTYSAHELFLPGLDDAVRGFLEQERESLARQLESVGDRVLKPKLDD